MHTDQSDPQGCPPGPAATTTTRAMTGTPIPCPPRCLYLEITDRCNMNCPMCITRAYRGQSDEPVLSLDEIVGCLLRPFKRLGGKHFVISGGEPMLSPILLDVLKEATALGLNITFASNILSETMHRFDDIFTAIDDARHGFQFSFDSIVKGEMNRIRGKDVYDKVLDSISKIIRLRMQHKYRARLFAQIVLQEANLTSVFDTIRFLLDDVGVDGCEIQPRIDYANVTLATYRSQAFLSCSEEVMTRFLATARELTTMAASDRRLIVEGKTFKNWETFLRNPLELNGPCNSRNMVLVGAYGHFRGCLFSPTAGSIRDMSLRDYLQSEPRKRFLHLAEVCKICINGCT